MIGDLLDLTRAQLAGSISLARRPMDLQEVCDEAMTEIRAGHPDAVVRLHASGDLRGEWDDPDRLAQVVSNLVGNAIQHGSATPVTVTAQEQRDLVTFSVHNGGAPIPPGVMAVVFEPLTRGAAEGSSSSIGLGLFIARAIVSAHRGRIAVSSSARAGTTIFRGTPEGVACADLKSSLRYTEVDGRARSLCGPGTVHDRR